MSPMRTALGLIAVLFYCVPLATPAFSQADGDAPVQFIGFNTLSEGEAAREGFDAYIASVGPIMSRHGLSLLAFDATAINGSDLDTTVVTFGAGTNSGMAAFFQDPDFLAIFPDLLAVIADHNVVFTEDDLGPGALEAAQAGDKAVLGVYWTQAASGATNKTSVTRGTMASHGIAGTIEPLVAPQRVMILPDEDAYKGTATTRWIFRLKPLG